MREQPRLSQAPWALSSRTDATVLLAALAGELFWSMVEGSGPGPERSPLAGKSVLVVEDEFLLADEIADWLSARGANPVGPAESLSRAERLISQAVHIDCAVLDIRLGDDLVFPVALELHRRGVPLLFASAYAEEISYPAQLAHVPRLNKPVTERQLIGAVERMLD